MKLSINNNTQQKSPQLQSGELEQTLTELYQTELECLESDIDEDKKDTATINLLDIASVVEQYGLSQSICELVNEDKQLETYLNMDFSQYGSEEELGQVVAQTLTDKVYEDDEDIQMLSQNEVSIEMIDGTLTVILLTPLVISLVFKGLMKLLDAHYKFLSSLTAEMSEIYNSYLTEVKVNEEAWEQQAVKLLPRKAMEQRLEGLSKLGDYLDKALQKHKNIEVDTLKDLLNEAGMEMDLSKFDSGNGDSVISSEFEFGKQTMGEQGYTEKSFIQVFDQCRKQAGTAFEQVIKFKQYVKQAKEQVEKEKDDYKAGNKSKEELKQQKKRLQQQKQLLKQVLNTYLSTIRETARSLISAAKTLYDITW